MVAEYEANRIRARTREGMAVVKAKGMLKGRKPRLYTAQEKHLVALYRRGERTSAEIAEPFAVSCATIYRVVGRASKTMRRADERTRTADLLITRKNRRVSWCWRLFQNRLHKPNAHQ